MHIINLIKSTQLELYFDLNLSSLSGTWSRKSILPWEQATGLAFYYLGSHNHMSVVTSNAEKSA